MSLELLDPLRLMRDHPSLGSHQREQLLGRRSSPRHQTIEVAHRHADNDQVRRECVLARTEVVLD